MSNIHKEIMHYHFNFRTLINEKLDFALTLTQSTVLLFMAPVGRLGIDGIGAGFGAFDTVSSAFVS